MKSRSPRFVLQSLEAREVPAALTIITPDAGTTDAAWTRDMATAVAARNGGTAGGIFTVPTDTSLPAALPTTDAVTVDWSGWTSTAADAGTRLAAFIRTRLPATGTLDIHFIGAGAGAYVNLSAIRELAAVDSSVGRLQMTTLNAVNRDPIFVEPPVPPIDPLDPPVALPTPVPPAIVSGPGDGWYGYPGGPIDPLPKTQGLPVPANVDWADNYRITQGGVAGEQYGTAGAGLDVDLTAALAGWAGRNGDEAAEVHDWYHWTIDLGTDAAATNYADDTLDAQKAALTPAVRETLYSATIDRDNDGTGDALKGGANAGYADSVAERFKIDGTRFTGLDLVFVIDTTGSMYDDIDAVKAKALEMLQSLNQQVPDLRVGVVVFRDNPDGRHGDLSDKQQEVLIGFTTDLVAVRAAIQGISTGGGADMPESVYAGLNRAIDAGGDLGDWRGGSIRRSIVLMGDATPHLVEPGTGDTRATTMFAAAEKNVKISSVATTADDQAWWMFQGFSDLTDGDFFFTGIAPTTTGDLTEGGFGSGWYGGPMPSVPPVYGDDVVLITPTVPPPGGGSADFAAMAAGSVSAALRSIADDITGRPKPDPKPRTTPTVIVGSPAGAVPTVTKLDPKTGAKTESMPVFEATVTGGVRTATADLNGDGTEDMIVGTGPGSASQVKAIDGKTGGVLWSVSPFEKSFLGGVFVAVGDVNDDGTPDVVITPDEGGGPRVRVFDGKKFEPIADFFGIDDANFRGGARAALGDVNGDGVDDLVVSAGKDGGPRVAGFDGKTLGGERKRVFGDFYAFEQGLRNGVYVSVADIDGDGYAEVLAGGGPGGGPRVTAFGGKALSIKQEYDTRLNFFAGDPAARDGVRVTLKDIDNDGVPDVIAESAGTTRVFNGKSVDGAADWEYEGEPSANRGE